MDKTMPRGEPPPLDPERAALFLDYDGTLVGIAPTPDEAVADDACRRCWPGSNGALGGALAIVTGRPVADIDRFLAPLRLTVAGLHGLDLRPERPTDRRGCRRSAAGAGPVRGIRGAGGPISWNSAGGQAFERRLALSAAPEAAAAERVDLATRLASESAGTLRLQPGKMVVELLPAGTGQGDCAIDDSCRDCAIRRAQAGIRRR